MGVEAGWPGEPKFSPYRLSQRPPTYLALATLHTGEAHGRGRPEARARGLREGRGEGHGGAPGADLERGGTFQATCGWVVPPYPPSGTRSARLWD
jgi:hypothetical protein